MDPRVTVIEGRRVLVIERKPPLPPTLELLLEGGRDPSGRTWMPLRVTIRRFLHLAGARSTCLAEDHRLGPWLNGIHAGSDGVARDLSLEACRDCGAVCVRDRSLDIMPRLPTGGRPPARKDHVLGWYTGARPRQRIYS